jgi:hypothetical protein
MDGHLRLSAISAVMSEWEAGRTALELGTTERSFAVT